MSHALTVSWSAHFVRSAVRKILRPFVFQKWRENFSDSSEEQIFMFTDSDSF